MAGVTLAQAEVQLAAYLAAETAVLSGQSYEIGQRKLTRANLAEIRAGVESWDARVKALSTAVSGRGRSRNLSPSW